MSIIEEVTRGLLNKQDEAVIEGYKWTRTNTKGGEYWANVDGFRVTIRYYGRRKPGKAKVEDREWVTFAQGVSLNAMKRRAVQAVTHREHSVLQQSEEQQAA